jgi:5-deoxy-glucuronate isomerase
MTDQSERMIFRNTNAHLGRHISVTPHNSTNKHLNYARIILNSKTPSAQFSNGECETGFIVLSGSAQVKAGSETFDLSQYDGIYIPRDSTIDVSSTEGVDIAEFSTPVSQRYPLKVVRYQDVSNDPALRFATGGTNNKRDLSIVIGKNVEAGRLLLGFTRSEPGNWTSWPPHEHAKLLEEMYVYFNMPEPAFGIQMVYNNTQYPELVTVVRDGDAVLMPAGYHPNVSVPGHPICFLWAMAAHREAEDRVFGVVNVQEGFGAGGSGLEASRK